MATLAPALRLERTPKQLPFDWRLIARDFVLLGVPLLAAGLLLPAPLATLIVMLALIPIVAKAPVRGVYILVAAAVIVEIYPLHYSDSLTDNIPLFENLSNVGLPGLAMSPVEALMLEVGLVALVKARSEAGLAVRPRGPVARAYVGFLAVVLFTELHGLSRGGDFKLSLWELRPQAYGFIMFMFAGSLVRTRRQVITLAVVILLAIAFKAGVGVYRWQFTLNHDLGNRETLLAHEDSYFQGLFIVAVVAGLVWWRRRSLLLPLLAVTPLVVICLLGNQRRAGLYAVAAGLAALTALVIRFEPGARKRAIAVTALVALGCAVFIAMNWNKDYGLAAQLVRPIRAFFDPNLRDLSSDLYRTAENANLKFTFHTSPLIGIGFGMPFYTPQPQADISQIYPLWNVIPHNTLLWVPMRMGLPGMFALWGLIAMAVLQACSIARANSDPLIRGAAVLVVAAILAELMVAYGDLQLESYRNMIFLGALLGVLCNLDRLKEDVSATP